MPTISLPTLNVKYFSVNEIYLKGDDISVNQYCTENGITLSSYKVEQQRFSNNGELAYQYYDSTNSVWRTVYGFDKIVTEITYS